MSFGLSAVSIHCAVPTNPVFVEAAATLATPLLLSLLVILLLFLYSRRVKKAFDKSMCWGAALIIYFMWCALSLLRSAQRHFHASPPPLSDSYTSIARAAVKVFSCREIGEMKYLQADLSMVCYSSSHAAMIGTVGVPLVLLSLVVPVVTFFALRANKDVIYAARDPQTGAVVDPEQKKALQKFVYSKTQFFSNASLTHATRNTPRLLAHANSCTHSCQGAPTREVLVGGCRSASQESVNRRHRNV